MKSGISFSLAVPFLMVAVKLTAILGLSWIAVILLGRQSAAQRHRVWVAGILGALLLPLLIALVPMQYSGPLGGVAATWVARLAVISNTSSTAMPPPAATPASSPSYNSTYLIILSLVLVGVFLLLRLLAGLRQLSRIALSSKSLVDREWTSLIEELSGLLGIKRSVQILVCPNPAFIPVTWGILRPRIVLPSDADQWSAQRRRIVLTHELAHVSRQDWLMQMCAEFMCCVYWFHPLAWIAARKLRHEGERACDDAVLSASVRPADYAKELLEIVQTLGTGSRKWATALAVVRPSELERRFEAMLETSIDRSRLSNRTKLLVGVFAVFLVIPVAAFRLPAQSEGTPAPRGWLLAGTAPQNYVSGIDPVVTYQNHSAAYLKGSLSADQGFGTLMQQFAATQYVGKRIRFSATVKSEVVTDRAGLWMRVDQGGRVAAFDNMYNRPITGTTDWRDYSIVLDVPDGSTVISFGVLLGKGGSVWLSNVKLETVSMDTPTTTPTIPLPPEGPRNLDFEK